MADDSKVQQVGSSIAESEPGPPGSLSVSEGSFLGRGLEVHFEGVTALDKVDFDLRIGEVQGLIGPNGAGKTTLVNALTGFQRPSAGMVSLEGADVTGWAPHRLAAAGVARTFQSGRSFADLTVFENVEVGAVGVGVGRPEARDRSRQALSEVGLEDRGDLLARSLSSGEERRLQVARALAMRPKYLLLDEPAAGLNEAESDALAATITGLPKRLGCGVLVIEHDMRVIMNICERILVLDHGVRISLGTPDEVRADSSVIAAYLGTEDDGEGDGAGA